MDSSLPQIIQTMAQMLNDIVDSFTEFGNGECGFGLMDFEQLDVPSHVVQSHAYIMSASRSTDEMSQVCDQNGCSLPELARQHVGVLLRPGVLDNLTSEWIADLLDGFPHTGQMCYVLVVLAEHHQQSGSRQV